MHNVAESNLMSVEASGSCLCVLANRRDVWDEEKSEGLPVRYLFQFASIEGESPCALRCRGCHTSATNTFNCLQNNNIQVASTACAALVI